MPVELGPGNAAGEGAEDFLGEVVGVEGTGEEGLGLDFDLRGRKEGAGGVG